jgi:hypothetical protein
MYTEIAWAILALFPVGASYRDSLASPIDKQDNKHWHWLGFVFRFIFAIAVCPLDWLLAYAWYFWIVFDGGYNLFTNKSIWNIGTTAFSDKLVRQMGGHWYKFAGLILAVGYRLIFSTI